MHPRKSKNSKAELYQFKTALVSNLVTGIQIGIGISLGFLSTALVAVAVTGMINSFTAGEPLSSAKINENFASIKSALESIPNWTKSGSTAVYSDGNVSVSGRISSSVLGVYCGSSAATLGNLGWTSASNANKGGYYTKVYLSHGTCNLSSSNVACYL